MKKIIYLLILILPVIPGKCQDFVFKNQSFDDTSVVPDSLSEENEILIFSHVKKEISVTENYTKQFLLIHEKRYVNSDQSIEKNNKVYLPFRNDESVLTNKLRVILKNGQIHELQKSDIKEEVNQETGVTYHYYAIQGLEKGAMIENIFILEENPVFSGYEHVMQGNTLTLHSTFELIFPAHLVFKIKCYNGLGEAVLTEEAYGEDRNSMKVESFLVKPMPDNERYSNDLYYTQFLKYKLDANRATGAQNLHNYLEFSPNIYDNVHRDWDKKTTEVLTKFTKDKGSSSDCTEMIRYIESKIKNNISYNPYFIKNKIFTDAIKSKVSDELDLIKIYASLFELNKITYQIVLTSNRFEKRFDKDFETIDQVTKPLFYFPECGGYLDPLGDQYRYPFFNFTYGDNYGLFIREKEFGGIKLGIGEIKKIEIPSSEKTHDITNITVDFTKDIYNPVINTIHEFQGYSAVGLQSIKDYVSDEKYKEVLEDIAKNYTLDGEIISVQSRNEGIKNLGRVPFVLDMKFYGKDLIQLAGTNLLFNIGGLIGKQVELYQAENRVLPVEMNYPHFYTRKIRVLLPDGYVISNPEVFTSSHYLSNGDEKTAGWETRYSVIDNVLEVNNVEYYNVTQFPVSNFEEYKKVINAAADFNKIVVVIEKSKG